MGTVLASSVIADARLILQDHGKDKWLDAEMLVWLNEGQIETVFLKNDVSTENVSFQLAAGTKQSIPAGYMLLKDVIRNMGVDGDTPGPSIRKIIRSKLDELLPDWHLDTADAVVVFAMADQADNKLFYVYPPQPAASQGHIETSCVAVPDAVAAVTAPITLDDEYKGALIDFILYRAFSVDSTYAGETGRAAMHYQKFAATLGAQDKAEEK